MISLSEKYYLVVNDRFELFYRGVIKSFNPYKYYVKATCDKGYTYNRYFTYTPKDGEEGEYQLTIGVYDDEGNVKTDKDGNPIPDEKLSETVIENDAYYEKMKAINQRIKEEYHFDKVT